MPLFHLIYVSSAVAEFSDAGLVQLLERSRTNNHVMGVSGMLLYREGNFMQVLEGEKEAVRTVHARICRDPRHTGLMTLREEPIEQRTFAEWSMAFRNLNSPELKTVPGYSEFLNVDWRGRELRDQPDRALKLLELFRHGMR